MLHILSDDLNLWPCNELAVVRGAPRLSQAPCGPAKGAAIEDVCCNELANITAIGNDTTGAPVSLKCHIPV